MKKLFLITALLLVANSMFATIILVDKNGAGQYSTIQAAINVASAGDTVRVWPGTYQEQITLNKNILLEGSGYENTIITGNFNPTIDMNAGILQWFQISSVSGNGISLKSGIVKNCVIRGCSIDGINCPLGSSSILNCIIAENGRFGIWAANDIPNLTVINCIGRGNADVSFKGDTWYLSSTPNFYLSYSNGNASGTKGNQGVINIDPQFVSITDYHIPQGSPCWNTGNPSLGDPDGSVSDIGYFGGPVCPIFPVVYEIQITPNGSNINFQAKGRANY